MYASRLLPPRVDRGQQVRGDAAVGAVRREQRTDTRPASQRRTRRASPGAAGEGGGVREAVPVLSALPGGPRNDVLHHPQRADDRTVHAAEKKRQDHQERHDADIQGQQGGQELDFRHPAEPRVKRSGKSRNSSVVSTKKKAAAAILIFRNIDSNLNQVNLFRNSCRIGPSPWPPGRPRRGFWRWTGFGSDATGGEQGQRIDFNANYSTIQPFRDRGDPENCSPDGPARRSQPCPRASSAKPNTSKFSAIRSACTDLGMQTTPR